MTVLNLLISALGVVYGPCTAFSQQPYTGFSYGHPRPSVYRTHFCCNCNSPSGSWSSFLGNPGAHVISIYYLSRLSCTTGLTVIAHRLLRKLRPTPDEQECDRMPLHPSRVQMSVDNPETQKPPRDSAADFRCKNKITPCALGVCNL